MAKTRPRLGRPPRDPAEVARQWTLRSTPGDLAAIDHAAAEAGLPRGTWAAQKLAELAAGPTPPRFAALESVLAYVQELDGEARDAFVDLAIAALLDDPALLRGAIAAAWAADRSELVRAVCEEHAARAAAPIDPDDAAIRALQAEALATPSDGTQRTRDAAQELAAMCAIALGDEWQGRYETSLRGLDRLAKATRETARAHCLALIASKRR